MSSYLYRPVRLTHKHKPPIALESIPARLQELEAERRWLLDRMHVELVLLAQSRVERLLAGIDAAARYAQTQASATKAPGSQPRARRAKWWDGL